MPDVEYHNRVTPGGYTRGMALNTAIGIAETGILEKYKIEMIGADVKAIKKAEYIKKNLTVLNNVPEDVHYQIRIEYFFF